MAENLAKYTSLQQVEKCKTFFKTIKIPPETKRK